MDHGYLCANAHSGSAGSPQANTDRQTVDLWLHNQSPHTKRAYLNLEGESLPLASAGKNPPS
jgi:hypothetical protein